MKQQLKKPKLAIVTSVIDNRKAKGTALVARKLLDFLPLYKDQFDITLIHATKTDDPFYKEYPELLIPSINFPFGKQLLNESIFWIKHWLTGTRFDVVHYMQPRVWPSYLLTTSPKIVITMHEAGIMLNLHHIGFGERLFRFTNRYLHQRMSAVIAVSEFGKKEIADLCHIPLERIFVIPNAVDDNFRKPEQIQEAPESYILSVGRLDPHKNILRLIDAYKLAQGKGLTEKLMLVGGRHLPEYSKKVEGKIKEYNLEQKVIIAPFIPESDLPRVYSEARALVYPSLHEGFGLPILEAFACHTPVAISQVTSLPEIAGDAALLFDPENTESISDALLKITHDEELRKMLITKGTERVKDFSWKKSAEKLFKLYSDLVASR